MKVVQADDIAVNTIMRPTPAPIKAAKLRTPLHRLDKRYNSVERRSCPTAPNPSNET
ncbi:MAG: hypothetical protein ACLUKN_05610 [Bacilli bacterium]